MILSIRDVQRLTVEYHALRSKKLGVIERTIIGAMAASADVFDQVPIELCQHDPIVIRIGDEQPVALLVCEDLAGKGQREVADFGAFKNEFKRCFVQLSALAEIRYRVSNSFISC